MEKNTVLHMVMAKTAVYRMIHVVTDNT